jgi:hypothetical protein
MNAEMALKEMHIGLIETLDKIYMGEFDYPKVDEKLFNESVSYSFHLFCSFSTLWLKYLRIKFRRIKTGRGWTIFWQKSLRKLEITWKREKGSCSKGLIRRKTTIVFWMRWRESLSIKFVIGKKYISPWLERFIHKKTRIFP